MIIRRNIPLTRGREKSFYLNTVLCNRDREERDCRCAFKFRHENRRNGNNYLSKRLNDTPLDSSTLSTNSIKQP